MSRTLSCARVMAALTLATAFESSALAQETPAAPKALVDAPKAGNEPKPIDEKGEGITATATAGGLFTTGNSKTTAITGSGLFDDHFDRNELSLQIIGNYAEGGKGKDSETHLSAANVQGRGRYDRFFTARFGAFAMYTHRYDQLQGLDARINVDPGIQYLVLLEDTYKLGLELGYDVQHDIRRNKARVQVDDDGVPLLGADGLPLILDKTQTNHGVRVGAAYKHAFNKEVSLQSNLEYLQPLNDTSLWRMNFNAVLAANLAGGFAIGAGFNLLYDHGPLPGKTELDTATTIQLIYSFSTAAPKPASTCAPCAEAEPPPALPPPPPPPRTPLEPMTPAAPPPGPASPDASPPPGAAAPGGMSPAGPLPGATAPEPPPAPAPAN